jgi:hypothetical protein
MARFFSLCAGVLALATLAPAAGSQETPPPEDMLAKTLTIVKSPGSAKQLELQDARQYLVEQRQVARPMVVEMLGDADALVRMNAAIILCNMAQAGDTSAATLQAMRKAVQDKDLAVAYWGFMGLMSPGMPAADQRAVMSDMMKKVPRALRLAALSAIGEQKPAAAAPIIVRHLQEILKEYRAQVETIVTSNAQVNPANTPPSFVKPTISAPTPQPQTAPPPVPATPAPGMGAEKSGAKAPGTTAPANVPAPVLTWSGDQVSRAALTGMTFEELQTLAQTVESIPVVAEVHHMGLTLEDIVAGVSPDAPLFDFKTTPPWDLDKCVDRAVIYMNEHRAEYGAATEAPKTPAPAPAVHPEAAPSTAPAPATTATTR